MLIAIDPGRDTGWAEFMSDGTLFKCGLGDPRGTFTAFPEVLVIERPQIYQAGKNSKQANPNDLITLAIRVGWYEEWFRGHRPDMKIEEVLPFEWKRQLPKSVCAARVYAALNPMEQSIVDVAGRGMSPNKVHNMMDAIGVGLFYLGRVKAGMVARRD